MISLKVSPDLAQALRDGRKTVHRLPAAEAQALGPGGLVGQRLHLVEALPFGKTAAIGIATVSSVQDVHLEDMDDSEIAAEGFASWALFSHHWDDRYGRKGLPAILNPPCVRLAFVLEPTP